MEMNQKECGIVCKENGTEQIEKVTEEEWKLLKQYRNLCEENKLTINILIQRLLAHEKGNKLIKVALCDDIIDYNKKMESYIEKYGNENHVEVKITSYGSGSQLLLNYQKRKFDVIFLDVSMPEMDGFETAEEIRKSDTDVSIVFCTSYYTITNAGKGFEVAAEDFLSKPLLYRKVENILNKIYKKKLLNAEEKLFLKCHDGLITLQLSDIIYIQTENKLLILHTIHGDVQSSQRMSELEKRLSKKQFFRCHNSYMVNFDYVEGVKKDSVLIKDKVQKLKTIPISKYKKEEFMRALARYVGKWEN